MSFSNPKGTLPATLYGTDALAAMWPGVKAKSATGSATLQDISIFNTFAWLLDKDVAADVKPISQKIIADVSAIRTRQPAAKRAKVKDNGKNSAASEAMKMFKN